MIKVEHLEKQNKIASKKKEKLENQNISQSIKPHKPVKMPKVHNHRPQPQLPQIPQENIPNIDQLYCQY